MHTFPMPMVRSTTGLGPHLVKAKKGGQYGCPNWKSLKVCSHAVAAAEDNGDLDVFIQCWKKLTKASHYKRQRPKRMYTSKKKDEESPYY